MRQSDSSDAWQGMLYKFSKLTPMLLHRAAPAVALRKGKSQWLFDCGEDTQRQLLKQALVRIAVK